MIVVTWRRTWIGDPKIKCLVGCIPGHRYYIMSDKDGTYHIHGVGRWHIPSIHRAKGFVRANIPTWYRARMPL